MDNVTLLQATQHMFEWFNPSPFQAIRNEIETILYKQVADSKLEQFTATSEPDWLTGAKKIDNDADNVILVRAGVAFEFELTVKENDKTHFLKGVFTWVGYHFDEPKDTHIQTWFDIDGTLAEFGKDGKLMERLYLQ